VRAYANNNPFFCQSLKDKVMTELIPSEIITGKIHLIRGRKIMLDRDLAELYGLQTKALKQAVRRNIDRFPGDFMFELSIEELNHWRSQFVTSNSDKKGLRYPPKPLLKS
jgi:hypothetical protein